MTRCVVAAALAAMSLQPAMASPDIVDEVAGRFQRNGVEATNAYLSAHWESAMAALNRRVQRCDAKAMRLALQLLASTNAEAQQAHAESLSAAMGRCPEQLLPLVPSEAIAQFCHVGGDIAKTRLLAEIHRRIGRIEAQASLRTTRHGQACMAAYRTEAERAKLEPWQPDEANGRPIR